MRINTILRKCIILYVYIMYTVAEVVSGQSPNTNGN